MAETSLTFDVLARDRASATFNRIGRNTDTLSKRLGSLSRTARVALGGFAVYEAGRAVRAIGSIGVAYQNSLNVFQAVTRATGQQIDAVGEKAQALGANLKLPATSAADAAAAMTELAKGGLSVRQSMQAALGTLQLAAAAQVDGAEAAKIQSSALAQFRLSGKAAGHVADLLANSANAAQGEITDMATALTYVGPVARAAGVSIDDTATALSVLAKNGILGQKAGTGLRGILASLEGPTTQGAEALKALGIHAFDAQGNFVGLRSTIDQLSDAQHKFNPEGFARGVKIAFGKQGLAAVNALAAGGAKEFDNFAEKVTRAGGAQELASAKSRGLGGALQGLQSQLETLAIDIFRKVSPSVEGFVRNLSKRLPDAVEQMKATFQRARPTLERFGRNAARLAGAFADALKSFKPFAEFAGTVLVGALRGVSRAMGRLADAPGVIKDITRAVVIGAAAWKTYAFWVKASEAASLRFGGGGAGGKGGAAANGGIFGAVAALTGTLVRMAQKARLAGEAWLGLGRIVSHTGAGIFAASQDTASATQLNSDAIRFSISDYLKYTHQLKTATGAERARILQLRRVTEAFLEANNVTTVNGRKLENLAGHLSGLPALFAAAAQGARDFTTALRGGGKDASYGNFSDPGHPGYVPPTTSSSSGGKTKTDTGSQALSLPSDATAAEKSVADGVNRLAQKALDRLEHLKQVVAGFTQRLKDLKRAAADMARSIAGNLLGSASLGNVAGTDLFGTSVPPTVQSITTFLQDQLKADRKFRHNLKSLAARGLSQRLVRQLAELGVDAGGPIAATLATATRSELHQINRLQGGITRASQGIGRDISSAHYGSRIAEANRDQREANRTLKDIRDDFRRARRNGISHKEAHQLQSVVSNALDHLRIVTDTDKQDHKQGQRVNAS